MFVKEFYCWYFNAKVRSVTYAMFSLTLNFLSLLKVSKSQKQFFLKLHCPKNERNIWQILPYEARAEFCQIFRSFFYGVSREKLFWDLLTFIKTCVHTLALSSEHLTEFLISCLNFEKKVVFYINILEMFHISNRHAAYVFWNLTVFQCISNVKYCSRGILDRKG